MRTLSLQSVFRPALRPAVAVLSGAALLAGCAIQPVPSADQSSIVSRLPSDYAFAPAQSATPPAQAAPVAPRAPAAQAAPTPPLSEQERQRYADIDKQVQREQTQSMAAYQAAQYAYYYPQPVYYAPPVVVGGYYGGYGYGGYGYGGYGYRGCCWGGGPRWSVGVGYSTGWGW
jgi:hypothetical protein